MIDTDVIAGRIDVKTTEDKLIDRLISVTEDKQYWMNLATKRLSLVQEMQKDLLHATNGLAEARHQVQALRDSHKNEQEALGKLRTLVDAAAAVMPFVSTRAGDRKAKLAVATTDAIDYHGRQLPF
jgi:hypothetical protein